MKNFAKLPAYFKEIRRLLPNDGHHGISDLPEGATTTLGDYWVRASVIEDILREQKAEADSLRLTAETQTELAMKALKHLEKTSKMDYRDFNEIMLEVMEATAFLADIVNPEARQAIRGENEA